MGGTSDQEEVASDSMSDVEESFADDALLIAKRPQPFSTTPRPQALSTPPRLRRKRPAVAAAVTCLALVAIGVMSRVGSGTAPLAAVITKLQVKVDQPVDAPLVAASGLVAPVMPSAVLETPATIPQLQSIDLVPPVALSAPGMLPAQLASRVAASGWQGETSGLPAGGNGDARMLLRPVEVAALEQSTEAKVFDGGNQTEATANSSRDSRSCDFEYNGGPASRCFCQIAGNPGCSKQPCSCPQGCAGTAKEHARSSTFTNFAKAKHCERNTGLLTIPKSYYSNIQFLRTWCPTGMTGLLEEMLRESFRTYQGLVAPSPVRQCIHSADHTSAAWLHLHTFCPEGVLDGMPNPEVAWCASMSSADEAPELARQIVAWAGGIRDDARAPRTCKEMGCGMYGPAGHCSCNAKCRTFGDCCADYSSMCSIHILQ